MTCRPRLRIVAPNASAEEAAAVVAALERFLRDRARPLPEQETVMSAWLAAALREGVARAPEAAPPWG